MLDIVYLNFISPIFSYAGLVTDVSFVNFLGSYILTLAWFYLILFKPENIQHLVFLVFSVFLVLPILSLWGLSNQPDGMLFVILLGLFVFKLFSVSLFYKLPVKTYKDGWLFFVILSLFFTTLLLIPLLSNNDINFNPLKVYEFREKIHQNLAGWRGYFLSWVPKVILPILIAVGMWKKNYILVLLICVLQLFFYGLTSHKEIVVYPVAVIFLSLFLRNGRRFDYVFLFLICLFIFSLILVGSLSGKPIITAAITNRLFHIIALNHFEYYAFFQDNPFVYWSNGILRSLIEYPFIEKVPLLVGEGRYQVDADTFVNAGMFASGYMHAGVVGVLIYSFLLSGIVFVAQQIANYLPRDVAYPLIFISFMQLINIDLLTALLTSGIALMLLLLYLIIPYFNQSSAINCLKSTSF